MVAIIVRSAHRLTHLVNALLDAVRTGFRRVPLRHARVDLATLTRSVLEQLAQSAERAGCTVLIDAESPVVGLWDEAGVQQILTNLLTNAMKFGAGHPVEVAVSRRDDRARVTVRDHGPGIDPIELPRLFDRFERGVSTRSFGGLGLGLYIARGIAEAHGGTVHAQSERGHGATFTLELPLSHDE
jgi:signal transduction histidine kinase